MDKIKIGVVGVGVISEIYIKNLTTVFKNVCVHALCDMDNEKATKKAEEHGIENVLTYDEMMKNEDVQIILNLTTPKQHYKVCKDALMNNKNVYVEKSLCLKYEEGVELVKLAREKDLLLGVAPDTFLGASIQTAIHAIKTGLIGDVVSANAFMLCHGHESWHPDPEFYYEVGGGPMYDMGPYYLTALVSMLGAAKMVCGMNNKAYEERTITSEKKYGKKVQVEIPTNVNGLIQFENGAIANIITSFDAWGHKVPNIQIHGTRGSLVVPDPNIFSGEVLLKQYFDEDFNKLPLVNIYADNSRGLGVCDMATCLLNKTKNNRASGELGLHVLEIMESLHKSYDDKKFITLNSTLTAPESLPLNMTKGFVE